MIGSAEAKQPLIAHQQCLLALLCTDAIVVQLDNIHTSSDILCTLYEVRMPAKHSVKHSVGLGVDKHTRLGKSVMQVRVC